MKIASVVHFHPKNCSDKFIYIQDHSSVEIPSVAKPSVFHRFPGSSQLCPILAPQNGFKVRLGGSKMVAAVLQHNVSEDGKSNLRF